MRDAGIGRILVASLHQAIADLMPTRLEFYENWLNPDGLREGRIGIAPLQAVLSFLRREGAAYDLVTRRAGEYAAEWTIQAMPALKVAFIKSAPAWLRIHLALRAARQLVRSSYRGSRALSRVRHGVAKVDVRASIFCAVREPVPEPLCVFYAAAFTRLLALLDLRVRTEVVACRGTGEARCVLKLAFLNGQPDTADPVEAL